MNLKTNPQLQLAYEFVENTGKNVFLTGKAGTGKTTFLQSIKKVSTKRCVVVAPTGVAAINAGGVTIHSFFQLPFGPQIPEGATSFSQSISNKPGKPEARFQKFNKTKINIIRSLDLLIIDEISMVRADLLDSIDSVLRRYKNRYKPFGGVQLLMIGDLQQLAPVVKEDEWRLLRGYYSTPFFFGSNALQQTDYISIELKHIFRQSDEHFIKLLNKIRNNTLDENTLDTLNKRFIPGFCGSKEEGYITLTTHNYQANKINQKRINALNSKNHSFTAKVDGDFPENIYPTDYELNLKEGAQVMFIKNDPSQDKLFYNGKIGIIEHIDDDIIHVKCTDDDSTIDVTPLTWENMRYTLNEENKEIKEKVIGSFQQYPLKLAWAITIHKSQGLTFEKAIIDAEAAFAHGQVYVALSRCKTLEGMVLNSQISSRSLKEDKDVKSFSYDVNKNTPCIDGLREAKIMYQHELLDELFDFSPLLKQTRYLIKLFKESRNTIDSELLDKYIKVEKALEKEIVTVGINFSKEINRLILKYNAIEANSLLQERIKKACSYFTPRLEKIIDEVLEKTIIESDNKQVEKTLNTSFERLTVNSRIKSACLEACSEGFKTKKYLEVRAKASIEKTKKPRKASAKKPVVNEASNHLQLYGQLKYWRNKTAEKLDMPVYLIMSRKSIVAISNELPGSMKVLLSIHGFGKKKADRFGEEIIDMVKRYCHKNNLQPNTDNPLEKKAKTKSPEKSPTKQITYDMFNEGKSVEEIAVARGLANSTISGHLSEFIATGHISVEKLLSPEKTELITEYFTSVEGDYRLGPAKEILGDDISYDELRWVLKHLIYTGQIQMSDST